MRHRLRWHASATLALKQLNCEKIKGMKKGFMSLMLIDVNVEMWTVIVSCSQFLPLPLVESEFVSFEFEDLDLDDKELGGNLTWLEPIDMTQVTSYAGNSD